MNTTILGPGPARRAAGEDRVHAAQDGQAQWQVGRNDGARVDAVAKCVANALRADGPRERCHKQGLGICGGAD